MNAVARLFRKKWLWFVAVIGLGLSGCAVFTVVAIITIAVSAYNCSQGDSCAPLATEVIAAGGGYTKIFGSLFNADPPASDLAYFDASKADALLTAQNITIASTGGTATVTLTDESSGATLGSASFPFVINNSDATFSNPAAVTNWLRSYSTYSGNVNIGFQFYTAIDDPPAGQSGTLTYTGRYAGSPYVSTVINDLGPTKPPACKPPAVDCKVQ